MYQYPPETCAALKRIFGYTASGPHQFAVIDRYDNNRFLILGEADLFSVENFLERNPQRHGQDVFFTPLSLRSEDSRRVDSAVVFPTWLLYADLDGMSPLDVADMSSYVQPSLLWETSPGNCQGVWFLGVEYDGTGGIETVDEFRRVNRALTYGIGADKGGWSPSKLLRVPGSLNFKRTRYEPGGVTTPRGRVISDLTLGSPVHGRTFLRQLDQWSVNIDPSNFSDADVGKTPTLMSYEEWKKWTNELMGESGNGRVPLRVWSWWGMEFVPDRSAHIFRILRALKAEGKLGPGAAFHLIWFRPWNKFLNRPEALWRQVCKVWYGGEDVDRIVVHQDPVRLS